MEQKLEHKRHTLAHLLAAAVIQKYPQAKLTLGPAIDTGFYYDIDFSGGETPGDSDLKSLQKDMKKLINKWTEFTHEEVSADKAREVFAGNEFKLELINEIEAKGEQITLYTCGGFTDLCRGGHSENPKEEIDTDAFKLDKIAGAYWRGNENNPMLTRIYGIAFDTKDELEAYEKQMEEAKARDHRKLGKELDLFTISPLVGAGLPLMKPRGMVIRQEIENYLWELHKGKGYSRVWTPHITNISLYETSGHAEKFGDELFRVKGGDEDFALKPMNCPHHMQIFADNQFSYRDMPVRYFEPATVYRYEKSGQLSGLTRVRAITQDDGHLFCRVSQITKEVSTIVEIIREFYKRIGLLDNYWVSLSVRGGGDMYLGDDEIWNNAEHALEEAAKMNNLNYKRVEGEAAFYGPKLDFMFKDAIGREWQLATIQCDFNLPEKFDLDFINEKGEKERPVVIHRAISGSLERFMGVMIEHFAGNFPLWLCPTQIAIIPVAEIHNEYAKEVNNKLTEAGFRVDLDTSGESMGKKIRQAKKMKLPYFIVIGDKDIEANVVTLESRDTGESMSISLEDLLLKLSKEMDV
ncbi:threonine--tRNA ligase [Candidatus Nomurabacteria bacterium]|nr:threonine--tRNA ligase [Candidatus Kaiserbacteria bacterium]MCB9810037.1 threonine--tRNA ligase [Candidatus Nomurabacteria bacterium]